MERMNQSGFVLPVMAVMLIVGVAAFLVLGLSFFLNKAFWIVAVGVAMVAISLTSDRLDDKTRQMFVILGIILVLLGAFGSQFGFLAIDNPTGLATH